LGRPGWTTSRTPLVSVHAAPRPLDTERTEAFIKCIEEFDPQSPEVGQFHEGPPPTGFRDFTEAFRPYHPNPEWMIFPEPGFARDQKICSMYTLATGLFKEMNKCLRVDNEDGMRRHAAFIWELRQVLRFQRDKICTPDGRKCKPFVGKVLRGLTVPVDECEGLANLYKVGTDFTWPAFTSCQLEEGGLWPFDGNLNFEIECNIDPKTVDTDEVYAPVSVKRFLSGSNEVLFPPHTKFRVVGERDVQTVTENDETKDVYTKILEVIELPTPWKG